MTHEELVEKVARGIAEAFSGPWDLLEQEARAASMHEASIAIATVAEALMDLTEEMGEYAANAIVRANNTNYGPYINPKLSKLYGLKAYLDTLAASPLFPKERSDDH